jgi:hypothetical protein
MAELQTIAKTIDGIFRSFPRSSVGMHSVTLRRHDTRRWSGLGWVPTLERGNHKNCWHSRWYAASPWNSRMADLKTIAANVAGILEG